MLPPAVYDLLSRMDKLWYTLRPIIKLVIAKTIQDHKRTVTLIRFGIASDRKDKVNINVKNIIHRVEKPILLSRQLA